MSPHITDILVILVILLSTEGEFLIVPCFCKSYFKCRVLLITFTHHLPEEIKILHLTTVDLSEVQAELVGVLEQNYNHTFLQAST